VSQKHPILILNNLTTITRSSVIADSPHNALCHWKFCSQWRSLKVIRINVAEYGI